MQDHVAGKDLLVLLVAKIEGRDGARVIGELRSELDLRRKPVLPSYPEIAVASRITRTLPLWIIIIFTAK